MIRFLQRCRPLFLSRTRREKVFFVAFVLVLALVWLGSVAGRVRGFSNELRSVLADSGSQAQWIDNRDIIEGRYQEALALLQTADLPTRNEVLAQIQALVSKYEFNPFTINPPVTEQRQGLLFHTYNVSLQRANWESISSFHEELSSALPTVNLEELTLAADRRNPALLDARLRLVAIEFNR